MDRPGSTPALTKIKAQIRASVIIPSWNGLELLRVCLPSLQNQSFKDFETIVVDNGSTDGSQEFIQKHYPKVKLISLAKNIGFSPAVNIGIQKSLGEFIILINNDTEVDPRCLEYLVKSAEAHPDVGMVAAKMIQFDNRTIVDSAGDYIDAVGHANNIGMGESVSKFNKSGYVFLVTGGGGLFKREMLEKVGLFDNSYFAYFEDVDLCLRAQLMGYKGWFEPRAIIYHIHKATSNKNKSFTEYLQFRNLSATIIKDFPSKLLWRDFNIFKIILVNLNTVRYLALIGYFKAAISAEVYILKNLSQLLKSRKYIQSTKVVSDDYIIQNILAKKVTFFGLFKKGI